MLLATGEPNGLVFFVGELVGYLLIGLVGVAAVTTPAARAAAVAGVRGGDGIRVTATDAAGVRRGPASNYEKPRYVLPIPRVGWHRRTVSMQVLVGRSAELATVRRLVDAAAGGRGGALLVAGEAGIGKTRLLDEAARRAVAAGMVVLSGRAVQGRRHLPGRRRGRHRHAGPARARRLRRAAALPSRARAAATRVGGSRPEWCPPATVDPVVLLGEGLLRLLHAGGPACLLRLEDLHWADDDTLALVEHLASAVAGTSVLLAVSARDEGRASGRGTGAPGVSVVRPSRLGRAEFAALAAACRYGRPVPDADVDRLFVRSEGMPFLVEELVDAPCEGLPPTLAGLVGSRLATLTEDERAVLAAAAVLGGELDWRLLARTADVGEPVAALRAAVSVALLTADLRWPHALTREAVLSSLLAPERAVLARLGAEVLARRAGSDDRPRVAELYLDAGEPGPAAELLLELARDARHAPTA